jgi:cytochrome c biogenesis protein CcmG/thiol:disulfide interchange protein DsbE
MLGHVPIRVRRMPVAATAPLLAAAVLSACGAGASTADLAAKAHSTPAQKAAAARRLAKAPAALRVNAADADALAGVGADALKQRLAKLRGHPVVVNSWASWCGPCRAEFPLLSDAVVANAGRVAFLGIDFEDARDDAERFMREIPPGFASISDPRGDAARSLGGGRISPSTFFIAPDGKVVYTRLGTYVGHDAALEADIRHYALGVQ